LRARGAGPRPSSFTRIGEAFVRAFPSSGTLVRATEPAERAKGGVSRERSGRQNNCSRSDRNIFTLGRNLWTFSNSHARGRQPFQEKSNGAVQLDCAMKLALPHANALGFTDGREVVECGRQRGKDRDALGKPQQNKSNDLVGDPLRGRPDRRVPAKIVPWATCSRLR